MRWKMFSYDSYFDILNMGIQNGCNIFLRHDVDVSIDKALKLAEMESNRKIKATYYILLTSPFYNALSPENIQKIKMIKELGHGIGLHYDLSVKDKMTPEDVKNEIMIQYGLLLHHLDHLPSASVTFHKPVTGVDATNEIINLLNMEEIYCPNYDAKYKYISDSGHNWREDPVEALMKYDHVHINTHPVWYNEKELSMEDCLLNLRLDIEADKRILKEVKVIKDYLVQIKHETTKD